MKKLLAYKSHLIIMAICIILSIDSVINNGKITTDVVIGATVIVFWLCSYDLFNVLWATLSTLKKRKRRTSEQMKINVTYRFNNRSLLQKVFTAPKLSSCIAQAIKYADAYEYDIESIETIYK